VGREVVGLEIGASKLAAARVSTNGTARLLQVATEPLPPGVVSSGEVREPEALTEALKRLFGKNKLPRRSVRLGVANNRVGVRVIDVTGIEDPRQLGNAVRFRAQEALPIPLTEAVLDYQVLGESVDADGQKVRRVLFAVAYRDLVDGYADACKQAGIRLIGVDLEAFALLRALTPIPGAVDEESDRAALVAICIGSERSILGVSDGYAAEFTRMLEWGGATLTASIARELEIEPDDAERLKLAISLDSTDTPEDFDEGMAAKAREMILLGLQGLARDIISSLQFYQNQPGSLGIREIVLAGGTAKLAGLAEALQRMVAVKVTVGDPALNCFHKKIKGGDADPGLTIAIGLGMGL
jgi:type IV pilus assembly protein PilM